jgi:hypothetical protein
MALQQKSKQQIRKFRRERRRVEETEIEELERRIIEDAPPKGVRLNGKNIFICFCATKF